MKLKHGERLSLQTKKTKPYSLNINAQIQERNHDDNSSFYNIKHEDHPVPHYPSNKEIKNGVYRKFNKKKVFKNF